MVPPTTYHCDSCGPSGLPYGFDAMDVATPTCASCGQPVAVEYDEVGVEDEVSLFVLRKAWPNP